MKNYVVNTFALAQNKEGALTVYPEREKEPLHFYLTAWEKKKDTAYVAVTEDKHNLALTFYGLQTPGQLRGFNLVVKVGPQGSGILSVSTNFDIVPNEALMKLLWPGGPYSFLAAIVALEEEIYKDAKDKLWLRPYLLEGGIGTLAEKRIKWQKFFIAFKDIFK